ncbi:putative tumor protein p63-regulated protein 1-like protein [Apostichopus japonicus]|uniref:Putative tumor protein p63-regulated protein 1-like protein n=1 Tax=Stichopus japonicus TaxID=307972 RepID=A0A2G8LF51_STIJA|nr:putative tumor protein p63-regulated protein 1-like protein [Apostichopus japonicus]
MADQEENLEQNVAPDVSFDGVKLSLNSENEKDGLVELPPMESNSPRSIIGDRISTPLPAVVQEGFFARKTGRLEEAVSMCQKSAVDNNIDGTVQGVWLLTEVDHWDIEMERIIILTEKSMLKIRYDFVSSKFKEGKRILFRDIDSIQMGLFEYPEKTFVKPRDGVGIRIHWGKGRSVGFFERWNPLASSIPYTTLISHPLEHGMEPNSIYEVKAFTDALTQAVNLYRQEQNASSPSIPVTEAPIQTDIFIGWHSSIFNQSRLGYSRERGGISF